MVWVLVDVSVVVVATMLVAVTVGVVVNVVVKVVLEVLVTVAISRGRRVVVTVSVEGVWLILVVRVDVRTAVTVPFGGRSLEQAEEMAAGR
ncbi:hypothetical protein EDC01DRAFT_645859 [Geopyxis carbonaria]|nr:hypothetical protein EDC01DRAFT_645859 [Geopyxis carbonaria]